MTAGLLLVARLPHGARGVVQAGGLVRVAAHVSGADDAVTVGERKVEQAPRVDVLAGHYASGDGVDQLVDGGDGLEHGLPQDVRAEAVLGLRARVEAHALERVQEQGKGPFAVGTADDAHVPLVRQSPAQPPLDVLPPAQATVVHPHQAAMAERVAVVLAQRPLGGRANMGEDQVGGGLGGEALQVGAVPGGRGRGEQARRGAELGICVEADAEAVGVVLAAPGILRQQFA